MRRTAQPTRPGCDDPGNLLFRASAPVDVGAPELGRQKIPAAEHIKGQVAVTIVVGVEEPALPIAMQTIVGGVEIEDYLLDAFACASIKRSTNKPSTTTGSCAIFL